MASRNADLYRWKRWSQKDPPSSNTYLNTKKKSQVSATDDIQNWIKKVEKASDRAAALTFGHSDGHHGDFSSANGYGSAAATLEALHDHDESHAEAQDLLSQWMAQKCSTNDDDDDDLRLFEEDDDVRDYAASKKKSKSELKSHWDDMLAENDPIAAQPHSKISSDEFFQEIESRDDHQAVQNIMESLMKKDVIETAVKKNLNAGAEKTKKHDPRVTMAARQQKVKENREKRQQSREAHLRQQRLTKEAQSQAHQMVIKEERNKALQRQREEALIQQEMARLRKEMQEQRRLEDEAKAREREQEMRKKEMLRQEEEKRRQEELQNRLDAESFLEEERQQMRQKLEEARAVKASQDLKSLQRHFHAWYQLVLSNRLAVGKARAVADWRTLLRAWNAWRAYVRASRAERQTREIEENFKDLHRKKQLAEAHHHHKLLRKYFSVWCLWLRHEHHSREVEQQQHQTKSKMAAFLEAAASGKLWTNRSEDEKADEPKPNSGKKTSADRPDSVAEKLDEMFGQSASPRANPNPAPDSARSDTSSQSDTTKCRPHSGRSAGPTRPKYAWQVMRKHADLPLEDLLTAGDEEGYTDENLKELNHNQNNAAEKGFVTSAASTKKTINYKANTFEHRYAAQQRILHEQQQQLREQKRLIEDLQTAQRQQQLQMQLGGGAVAAGAKPAAAADDDVHDSEGSSDGPMDSGRSQPDSCTAPSTVRSDHSESSMSSVSSRTKDQARPQLLKGMREREATRLKMKAEREERQRKKEQEKLAEIRAKEEQQRQEEEAEKKAKMEKRREEKRLAKQRELEKQQRLEHQQQQTSRADDHYRRTLMLHKGLHPWRRLVNTARQNMQVAEDHHSNLLLKKCLLPWKQYTDEVLQEKVAMADKLFEVILVRRAFQCWRKYGHLQSIQLQKARRHYAYTLKGKVLQTWQQYVTDEKLRMWKNEEAAQEHNERRIMKTSFLVWRQYPKMLKAERLREKRLQDMRKKVASILPDFGD